MTYSPSNIGLVIEDQVEGKADILKQRMLLNVKLHSLDRYSFESVSPLAKLLPFLRQFTAFAEDRTNSCNQLNYKEVPNPWEHFV